MSKRHLRLIVTGASNDVDVDIPDHRSATEVINDIRTVGGVWVLGHYIPYHSIEQAFVEED
jgi:hypothetical protein